MIDMAVVVLFAVLLIAASAEVFSGVSRDMRDVLCFWLCSLWSWLGTFVAY